MSVEHFAVDMHEPFIAAIERECPNAKVCVDRFHLAQKVNEAFDKVRRFEFKKPKKRTTKSVAICSSHTEDLSSLPERRTYRSPSRNLSTNFGESMSRSTPRCYSSNTFTKHSTRRRSKASRDADNLVPSCQRIET
ncbi:MAG: transposase [Bdellovibrionales bacterium]|nr:transposase [Bdellovibrionales bacterium]